MISVLGPGRVGQVFLRCAQEKGEEALAVGRTDPLPPSGPVLVCVRNDALADVAHRNIEPGRLIFVQNGIVEAPTGATLGILYFAATDRSGKAEPGGDSYFFGPLAQWTADLLGEIPAVVVERAEDFRREQGIKLGWGAALGLLGEVFGEEVGASVGRPELAELAEEWAPVLSGALNAPVSAELLLECWRAYSARIPRWRAAVRDLPYRNGYLLKQAAQQGFVTPVHRRLLASLRRPDVDALLR